AGAETAAPRENGDLRTVVDQRSRLSQKLVCGSRLRGGKKIGAVFRHIGGGAFALGLPILHVLRNRKVRNGAVAERRLDRFIQRIDDVIGTGDALVVSRNIHEKLVEVYVLLVMRAD